ncbi:DUF4232 domain-containing protein [Streptomyces roseirectus]|uniref:DUF4232 domain-containing protein n=1 Tax=Streptomyces roseirectus TaxID=2768066 RepID=A0A7H0IE37_9ACTN|nr:DUF4232 domain-containing protein [Streptomyces roseirectus]QNP71053.1 DUF4232 domain-containing protein [Streptomyces roseirectus]
MRAVPLRLCVAVFSAALVLSACSGGGDDEKNADAGASPSASAAGGGSGCAADKLDAAVGAVNAAPGVGDSGNVTFTLTNTGAECSLAGFPQLELKAGGASAVVPQDPAAVAQEVTLPEQGTASFTVTYTRGDGDKAIKATKLAFGVAAGAVKEFDWSYGDVVLADAKKADATVSGFQQAGD